MRLSAFKQSWNGLKYLLLPVGGFFQGNNETLTEFTTQALGHIHVPPGFFVVFFVKISDGPVIVSPGVIGVLVYRVGKHRDNTVHLHPVNGNRLFGGGGPVVPGRRLFGYGSASCQTQTQEHNDFLHPPLLFLMVIPCKDKNNKNQTPLTPRSK